MFGCSSALRQRVVPRTMAAYATTIIEAIT
jgi:hypothetical protein